MPVHPHDHRRDPDRDGEDQEVSIWIDTTAGGNLTWDSPMKRVLRIIGNNGQSHVIYDDRRSARSTFWRIGSGPR